MGGLGGEDGKGSRSQVAADLRKELDDGGRAESRQTRAVTGAAAPGEAALETEIVWMGLNKTMDDT